MLLASPYNSLVTSKAVQHNKKRPSLPRQREGEYNFILLLLGKRLTLLQRFLFTYCLRQLLTNDIITQIYN